MTGEATPSIERLTYAGLVLGAVALGSVALFRPAQALLRRSPADEMTVGQ
ncbi:MAG: hypothetical protein ACR2KJ_15795 [Jatrophihabitans sp.]